jgi:membrane fusion protein, multidrug efflux system
MRKLLSTMVIGILLISCGSKDSQSKLRELESQRDALNEKISELKKEIAQNNGDSNKNHISYVEIRTIKSKEFKHYIKIQGTIESDNNILLSPQTGGIVKKIYVNEGERVQKGQLLAELDAAIYESTLAELKTNLELAQTVFERQERLWNKKIGSEIQYLQAKTNKESLEQKLNTVNEQYKLTKITSPISGTVDQILIKEGEAAAPGFGAIRVVQLSDLKINAALSESYISNVKTGDLVDVNIPVLEKNLKLKIDAVSQVIDPKNRTFNIEITIPKNESSIKANMLAVLTINDYTNPEALIVPVDVLQQTGSEAFLFLAKEHPEYPNERWLVEKRIVKAGKYYDEEIEITEGLSENEDIVVFGFQDLADGQQVKINNQQTMIEN